jgi:hypothetical protein
VTEWAPVVYGRTLVADQWWRALPAGLHPGHWVARVVLDTVANGAGLARPRSGPGSEWLYAPRMTFARGAEGTLVGVACRARQLDENLCQDRHGRELYCFVGWFTADPAAAGIPPQAALAPGPESWAGATYREYAADVWGTPAAALSILESKRGRPPWEAAPAPAPPMPDGPVNLPRTLDSTSPGHVMVFRSADAAGLWTRANEAPGPFILVTGWRQARQAPLERITVLTADDVTKAEAVPRPSTPVAHQDPPARQARRPGLLSRITNSVFGAAGGHVGDQPPGGA